MQKLLRWRRKKVVLVEDSRSIASGTSATQTADGSPRPKDQVLSGSMQPSFFQSSSNVEIQGGQFNNILGHHTNLTINLNQGGVESLVAPDAGLERHHINLAISGKDIPLVGATDEKYEPIEGVLDSGRVSLRPSIPPVQKSSDIYFRHLSVKDLGYPLWIPEPNNKLPVQYRKQGVEIGDVGIITPSGSFDFLFNICLPATNPINPPLLPEHFTPLFPPLDPIDTREHLEFKPNSHLASSSIICSQYESQTPYVFACRPSFGILKLLDARGLSFDVSASEGAILAMPDGAYSMDLGNVSKFRKYMAANAEHWYKYANGLRGREALNGDVRLVIGCHKATSWGMATFSDLRERTEFHLRFKPTGESSVGRTYGWDYSGIADVRAGPDSQEIEDLRLGNDLNDTVQSYRNQCLFLRTLNVTLRSDIWDKLTADLEVDLDLETQYPAEGHSTLPSGSSHTGNSPSSAENGVDIASRSASGSYNLASSSATGPPVIISGTPRNQVVHPSRAVNLMLLAENPDARLAITEDWNWMSILKGDDYIFPSEEEICRRLRENHNPVVDQGVVYLPGENESPLHETNAATSISSGSQTWVGSKSPFTSTVAYRSPTMSDTTLESTILKVEQGEDDEGVRLLGLNRSKGTSAFIDTSLTATLEHIGSSYDMFSRSPASFYEQLLPELERKQKPIAMGEREAGAPPTPSPLRSSFVKSDVKIETADNQWRSNHDNEAVKFKRRGLGRMMSLLRR